jgi:RNA-directed DNA polymerase
VDADLKGYFDLNPMLRGWYQYLSRPPRNTFNELDRFIRRRLRALLRTREKRPGMGCCLEHHKRWNNAFFTVTGLFAPLPARLAAGQPR